MAITVPVGPSLYSSPVASAKQAGRPGLTIRLHCLSKIFHPGSGNSPAGLGQPQDNRPITFSSNKVNLDGPVATYFRENPLPIRVSFQHFSLKPKDGTATILSFFGARGGYCCIFITNK